MATSDPQPIATLPYHFDTAGVVTTIVRGIAALLCVVVIGVLYSIFASRNFAAAAGLAAIGVFVVVIGKVVLGNLDGTRGAIRRAAVTVEPGGVFGLRMKGPAGTFSIARFKEVRVERILPSADMQSHGHERLLLLGKPGTPDILIATMDLDVGRALGRRLAAELQLPFEEQLGPSA